ncbi:rRNA methyltransferase 2, mitochondrial-like [Liolophura sinensis]|uniref:rRNA methyltransferase 2, mitochondrial-like n=1 Tax=Liolophura sinensis TaxID=3198878 RepID=UPI003158A6FA
MTVIDCGAAPGSWSQVAVKHVNSLGQDKSALQGFVISVDLQYMVPVPGATILSDRDFTSAKCQKEILNHLRGQLADVVLSDMAPNATGVKSLDHDIIIKLCMSVTDFSRVVLKDSGSLLCKLWQGQDQRQLVDRMAARFGQVKVVKPLASRKDSAEVFVLAKDFKRDKEDET